MKIINVDKLELLELFEVDPIVVHDDEQAGVFMYSTTDVRGVKLVFLYDVYDEYCEFSLSAESENKVLCEYRLNNIKTLVKRGNNLIIISKNNEELTYIIFKPSISIGKIIV